MNKILNLGMAGLILAAVFAMTGCSTTPAYNSLPEENPNAAFFVGSWQSNDAMVAGSTGQQSYHFYADGVGEVTDLYDGKFGRRRVFRYRVSDEFIGFQFLQGTVFTDGGSFSRPYVFSADKRKITLPQADYMIGYFAEFTLTKTTPVPTPPPIPQPRPQEPEPKYANAGKVYYDYNGTGYVHLDNSVFYLCSNGKPVGYLEGGVIYAFTGRVLGYSDGSFLYKQDGDAVGCPYEGSLGVGDNVPVKKQISRVAPKQALPEKMPKAAVNNKPRLRNRYMGGVLSDVFGR
ncbi:MAG: hypothetical protein LBE02_09200 [Spirochaetaceae bacterium]|nr:hypothetical protein [Spirochaetaceae bacterium]